MKSWFNISGILDKLYTLRFILVLFIVMFWFTGRLGFTYGAKTATERLIDIGLDMVDIRFNDEMVELFKSNPSIFLGYIQYKRDFMKLNATNPFSQHGQASERYEQCMVREHNETWCRGAMITKYGERAQDAWIEDFGGPRIDLNEINMSWYKE